MPTTKKLKPPLKLYTKTGDTGKSSTITGKQLPKNHPLFNTLGTLDELNSFLGSATSVAPSATKKELQAIQQNLLKIGAQIAGSTKTSITKQDTTFLESRIDHYQSQTHSDVFNQFVLPGGSELAARLDIARSVCRRLERHLVSLVKSKYLPRRQAGETRIPKYDLITAYINRLSDYLYALRCHQNYLAQFKETPFKP